MESIHLAFLLVSMALGGVCWAHERAMQELAREHRRRLDAEARERQALADLAACRSALDSRLVPPFRHPVATGRPARHVESVRAPRFYRSAAEIGRMLKESR